MSFRGSGLYGGHGIYGDDTSDLRDYRTHPVIEQQLLNPSSQIWEPGNIFLRLHPEYLYPCLGERTVRALDRKLPPDDRKRAAGELRSLQNSIKKYFRPPRRSPGRPQKLTPADRDQMAAEHTRLSKFIRERCATDPDAQVPHGELNYLFRDPAFQRQLFKAYPFKQAREPRLWNRFLKDAAALGVGHRAIRYLALRYGVSRHTIHRAIWPARPSGDAPKDPLSSPAA